MTPGRGSSASASQQPRHTPATHTAGRAPAQQANGAQGARDATPEVDRLELFTRQAAAAASRARTSAARRAEAQPSAAAGDDLSAIVARAQKAAISQADRVPKAPAYQFSPEMLASAVRKAQSSAAAPALQPRAAPQSNQEPESPEGDPPLPATPFDATDADEPSTPVAPQAAAAPQPVAAASQPAPASASPPPPAPPPPQDTGLETRVTVLEQLLELSRRSQGELQQQLQTTRHELYLVGQTLGGLQKFAGDTSGFMSELNTRLHHAQSLEPLVIGAISGFAKKPEVESSDGGHHAAGCLAQLYARPDIWHHPGFPAFQQPQGQHWAPHGPAPTGGPPPQTTPPATTPPWLADGVADAAAQPPASLELPPDLPPRKAPAAADASQATQPPHTEAAVGSEAPPASAPAPAQHSSGPQAAPAPSTAAAQGVRDAHARALLDDFRAAAHAERLARMEAMAAIERRIKSVDEAAQLCVDSASAAAGSVAECVQSAKRAEDAAAEARSACDSSAKQTATHVADAAKQAAAAKAVQQSVKKTQEDIVREIKRARLLCTDAQTAARDAADDAVACSKHKATAGESAKAAAAASRRAEEFRQTARDSAQAAETTRTKAEEMLEELRSAPADPRSAGVLDRLDGISSRLDALDGWQKEAAEGVKGASEAAEAACKRVAEAGGGVKPEDVEAIAMDTLAQFVTMLQDQFNTLGTEVNEHIQAMKTEMETKVQTTVQSTMQTTVSTSHSELQQKLDGSHLALQHKLDALQRCVSDLAQQVDAVQTQAEIAYDMRVGDDDGKAEDADEGAQQDAPRLPHGTTPASQQAGDAQTEVGSAGTGRVLAQLPKLLERVQALEATPRDPCDPSDSAAASAEAVSALEKRVSRLRSDMRALQERAKAGGHAAATELRDQLSELNSKVDSLQQATAAAADVAPRVEAAIEQRAKSLEGSVKAMQTTLQALQASVREAGAASAASSVRTSRVVEQLRDLEQSLIERVSVLSKETSEKFSALATQSGAADETSGTLEHVCTELQQLTVKFAALERLPSKLYELVSHIDTLEQAASETESDFANLRLATTDRCDAVQRELDEAVQVTAKVAELRRLSAKVSELEARFTAAVQEAEERCKGRSKALESALEHAVVGWTARTERVRKELQSEIAARAKGAATASRDAGTPDRPIDIALPVTHLDAVKALVQEHFDALRSDVSELSAAQSQLADDVLVLKALKAKPTVMELERRLDTACHDAQAHEVHLRCLYTYVRGLLQRNGDAAGAEQAQARAACLASGTAVDDAKASVHTGCAALSESDAPCSAQQVDWAEAYDEVLRRMEAFESDYVTHTEFTEFQENSSVHEAEPQPKKRKRDDASGGYSVVGAAAEVEALLEEVRTCAEQAEQAAKAAAAAREAAQGYAVQLPEELSVPAVQEAVHSLGDGNVECPGSVVSGDRLEAGAYDNGAAFLDQPNPDAAAWRDMKGFLRRLATGVLHKCRHYDHSEAVIKQRVEELYNTVSLLKNGLRGSLAQILSKHIPDQVEHSTRERVTEATRVLRHAVLALQNDMDKLGENVYSNLEAFRQTSMASEHACVDVGTPEKVPEVVETDFGSGRSSDAGAAAPASAGIAQISLPPFSEHPLLSTDY